MFFKSESLLITKIPSVLNIQLPSAWNHSITPQLQLSDYHGYVKQKVKLIQNVPLLIFQIWRRQ